MKLNKMIIMASSLTFGITGIFMTRPSKKYVGASTIYTSRHGLICSGANFSHLTTVFATGRRTAFFKTAYGPASTLVTSPLIGAKLYFKP